jgi:hypothetical protein
MKAGDGAAANQTTIKITLHNTALKNVELNDKTSNLKSGCKRM